MFVDIHTHHRDSEADFSIFNAKLDEISQLLTTQNVFISAGLHPWFIDENWERAFAELEKMAMHPSLLAIGECGLDKNAKSNIATQLSVLEKQVQLSEEIQKPLIIHCVGCFNELLQLKKQLHPSQRWIIHGFRGKPQLAEQLLKADCALSFGEHYNAKSIEITPLNSLFVETDESAVAIRYLYQQIAKAKACNASEMIAGKHLMEELLQTANKSRNSEYLK